MASDYRTYAVLEPQMSRNRVYKEFAELRVANLDNFRIADPLETGFSFHKYVCRYRFQHLASNSILRA